MFILGGLVPVVAFPWEAQAVVVVSSRIYENEIISTSVVHITTCITAPMSFSKLIDIVNISNNEKLQLTHRDIIELYVSQYQQRGKNIEEIVGNQKSGWQNSVNGGSVNRIGRQWQISSFYNHCAQQYVSNSSKRSAKVFNMADSSSQRIIE